MKHRHMVPGMALALVFILLLVCTTGCTQEDKPLPVPENVRVERGPYEPENDRLGDTIIVSWNPTMDPRVEGYAIFRAEQGMGATPGEKTEYELQAVTIATQYVDDELRTTARYPTIRYFYQVAAIGQQGAIGQMSEEVSIDHQAMERSQSG